MEEYLPNKLIRNLTEWFDELHLEDKLVIHKYITKIINKRNKREADEMTEAIKLHYKNKEV